MMFPKNCLGISLVLLLSFIWEADAAKVKRVPAGKKYKDHDPVHIVVNKVG
jgi:hypothetical protein